MACSYEGLAVEIIKSLKYERAVASVKPIAQMMIDRIPYVEPSTVVSYIPTANSRVRQRGYDQARLLSKEIARTLGLKYQPTLLRVGKKRQVGSTREQRKKQLEGVFVIRPGVNIAGKNILLVDDVVTTGASLTEVAKTLKKNGVRSVSAVVFAQTV